MSNYLYRCSEMGCWYILVLEDGESWAHKCPHVGHTKIGYSITMSLVSQCWEDLDTVMDKVMNPPGRAENPKLGESLWKSTDWLIKHHADRGQARGMAILLARFMVPHFHTPDHIAREARTRWEHRQRGEPYTTPGLAERQYEFKSDDKHLPKKEVPPTRGGASAKSKRASRVLVTAQSDTVTDAERSAIKAAKSAFTAEELAKVYQITVAGVKAIWETE